MGNEILPVLILAAIFWIGNKIYTYGYNKGVEDEKRNSRP